MKSRKNHFIHRPESRHRAINHKRATDKPTEQPSPNRRDVKTVPAIFHLTNQLRQKFKLALKVSVGDKTGLTDFVISRRATGRATDEPTDQPSQNRRESPHPAFLHPCDAYASTGDTPRETPGIETSRKRFTCVIAYPFVRRDSRTSVTLCALRLPNCTSTSLQ